MHVGHGGASYREPAARGRAEANCGLYAGKQPSKIQNKQHQVLWMWCRCAYDIYACASSDDLLQNVSFAWFFFFFLEPENVNHSHFSYLFVFSLFCLFSLRRLSSFVSSGCKLMNSCDRSPRVTDQLTGSVEIGEREEHIIQTTAPMPPLLPVVEVAPTTVEVAGAEAITTILDMVANFKHKLT